MILKAISIKNFKECKIMTKIKKIDPKSAQSVFAFACPCLGDCATICSCTADWKVHTANMESQQVYGLPGMQTVNYN